MPPSMSSAPEQRKAFLTQRALWGCDRVSVVLFIWIHFFFFVYLALSRSSLMSVVCFKKKNKKKGFLFKTFNLIRYI